MVRPLLHIVGNGTHWPLPYTMAVEHTGLLLNLIRRYKLVADDQVAQITAWSKNCHSARHLAKELIQLGWLTRYQAEKLLDNQGDDLALGAYNILDRLGQGGLSEVFKARHVEYDWTVALKIMRPEALENAEGRKQFLQEIEAMAELEHPNIVQFCDVDEHEGRYYFAMEYVTGLDLGKWVHQSGPLPIWQACEFIRQTALGLQHAFEHNLVHRDIKPFNLYAVAPDGKIDDNKDTYTIKILDWGLACLRSPLESQSDSNTPGKNVMGTIDYLAPEQALNSDSVDIRADVYSLGCTLYFLLSGHPPFRDGSFAHKLMNHQENEPTPIKSIRQDVPPEVAAILRRMMAKNPDARFQTPAAVALALKPFTTRRQADTAPTKYFFSIDKNRQRTRDETPLPTKIRALNHLAGSHSSPDQPSTVDARL